MATTSTVKHKPEVTEAIAIEEAYFFLRTAMWDQNDFTEYVMMFKNQGYQAGYDDGYEYHKETNDGEIDYERGYDKGYKDGTEEGWQEGYDTGYNEASRDEDYRR